MYRNILLGAVIAFGLVGVAQADTLVLKNGWTIDAKSIKEDGKGRVRVDHGCGVITIPKSMVSKIIKGDVASISSHRHPKLR